MSEHIAAPNRAFTPDPAVCCSLTPAEMMRVLGTRPAVAFGAGPRCQTIVNVGLFFDGTNNNMERDYTQPTPDKRFHTNIVRLFNAFPDDKQNTPDKSEYFYPFYAPGVGTPFPKIGEDGESKYGRAFAAGGQTRILWGLLQVYNAVHRAAFGDRLMMTDDEIAAKIRDYERRVEYHQDDRVFPEDPPMKRKDWFVPLTQELSSKLRRQLDMKRKPEIPLVSLSVFGFSRGAVQARAFCYWFQDAIQDGKFAGIDTEIRFLGLFDSVATVGSSDSVHESMALPRWLSSGHSGWAAEILKPLPSVVKKTVHHIAAHEQRMNFPSTRVSGGNVEEVLYPGMHSDVGGGYGAGDQGKARDGLSSLMSQIPLLHMYKAALLAGVPLQRYGELQGEALDDLKVDPQTIQAWNRYMDWSRCIGGAYDEQILRHYACYYRWRERLLHRLEQRPFYRAASSQDKVDLQESNARLRGDLVLVRYRADPFRSPYERNKAILLSREERAGANLMQVRAAEIAKPLTAFESFALAFFNEPQGVPEGTQDLFEDYMHDSLAGFYMAGAVTQLDRQIIIESVCATRAENKRMNGFQLKVYQENKEWMDQRTQATRSDDSCKMTKEAGFPVQTDEDVSDLRDWVIVSQTSTRREGGGYLRERVTFAPE